jgi:hypothetical protein
VDPGTGEQKRPANTVCLERDKEEKYRVLMLTHSLRATERSTLAWRDTHIHAWRGYIQ